MEHSTREELISFFVNIIKGNVSDGWRFKFIFTDFWLDTDDNRRAHYISSLLFGAKLRFTPNLKNKETYVEIKLSLPERLYFMKLVFGKYRTARKRQKEKLGDHEKKLAEAFLNK